MQEDTYRGDGLNLYAYCANNPVMYFDPSGHTGVPAGGCGGTQPNAEYGRTGAGSKGGLDVIGTVGKTNPFDLQPTHSPTLSKNKMNALMDDIKVNGIQEPIKYVEYNGQMYVVDGHHRLLAAKRLGLTEVRIEKVDLPYAGYNTIDDLLWFE